MPGRLSWLQQAQPSDPHATGPQNPDPPGGDGEDTKLRLFRSAHIHYPPASLARSTCRNPLRLQRPSLAPGVNAYHSCTRLHHEREPGGALQSQRPTCRTSALRFGALPARNSFVFLASLCYQRIQFRQEELWRTHSQPCSRCVLSRLLGPSSNEFVLAC